MAFNLYLQPSRKCGSSRVGDVDFGSPALPCFRLVLFKGNMMANRKAAVESLINAGNWANMCHSQMMSAVCNAFNAFDREGEKPEPDPKEYKLEAGCKVCGGDAGGWAGTVLSIYKTKCWVELDGLCGLGDAHTPTTVDKTNLTVTAPATPEAGDLIEIRLEDVAVRAVIRYVRDDGRYCMTDGATFPRAHFTIICKGKAEG